MTVAQGAAAEVDRHIRAAHIIDEIGHAQDPDHLVGITETRIALQALVIAQTSENQTFFCFTNEQVKYLASLWRSTVRHSTPRLSHLIFLADLATNVAA